MPGLSDDIANIIMRMLDENNGIIEIGRNELAGRLHCVPSQINYVLTTRFTSEQGYFIESRRGGSGGIRITRVHSGSSSLYIQELLNSIPEELSEHRTVMLLKNLESKGMISFREFGLLSSLYSEKALKDLDPRERLISRGNMMRNMLSCLMTYIDIQRVEEL